VAENYYENFSKLLQAAFHNINNLNLHDHISVSAYAKQDAHILQGHPDLFLPPIPKQI